jgi:hypothetical protein
MPVLAAPPDGLSCEVPPKIPFPQPSTADNLNPVTHNLDRGHGKRKLEVMHVLVPIEAEPKNCSRLNNPDLAAQVEATAEKSHVTPYSARFYPQVPLIQDFSREGATGRPQDHENKYFTIRPKKKKEQTKRPAP